MSDLSGSARAGKRPLVIRRARASVALFATSLLVILGLVAGLPAARAGAQTPPPGPAGSSSTTAPASTTPTTASTTPTTAPGGRPPIPKLGKQLVADPVYDAGVTVDRFNVLIGQAQAKLAAATQQVAEAHQASDQAGGAASAAQAGAQSADATVAYWQHVVGTVAISQYVSGPGADFDASLRGNPQPVYRKVTLAEVTRQLAGAKQVADVKHSQADGVQHQADKAAGDADAADRQQAAAAQDLSNLQRQVVQAEAQLSQLALGDRAISPDEARALLNATLARRGMGAFGQAPPTNPRTLYAIQYALAQQGKPYQWGGNGPDSFDCSGLTQQSYLRAGVTIPRVASDQQAALVPVSLDEAQPGDLVFFGVPATHVGMYIGNGNMVDAPYTGTVVRIEPVYRASLSGFGRVVYP
ncbi:MAG: NlpC/P60 family protein [Acidimicrobiales bacterium]